MITRLRRLGSLNFDAHVAPNSRQKSIANLPLNRNQAAECLTLSWVSGKITKSTFFRSAVSLFFCRKWCLDRSRVVGLGPDHTLRCPPALLIDLYRAPGHGHSLTHARFDVASHHDQDHTRIRAQGRPCRAIQGTATEQTETFRSHSRGAAVQAGAQATGGIEREATLAV